MSSVNHRTESVLNDSQTMRFRYCHACICTIPNFRKLISKPVSGIERFRERSHRLTSSCASSPPEIRTTGIKVGEIYSGHLKFRIDLVSFNFPLAAATRLASYTIAFDDSTDLPKRTLPGAWRNNINRHTNKSLQRPAKVKNLPP